ncbi:MAG: HU family DNA-binding protein [Planctomycetota bacterium]|nr:HU family DNA-binding protein [Planctomycetota bacterium]
MTRRDVRTITKKEIVDRVAEQSGLSRTKTHTIVQQLFDTVVGELSKGHRIELRDFGVFEVKVLAPRTAQNPRTLERVTVPERRTVRFKAGKGMREKIGKSDDARIPLPEPKAGLRVTNAGLVEKAVGQADAVFSQNNTMPR